MKNRKGEGDAVESISIFILLMGIFIIGYVILIPPAERDTLLDTNPDLEDSEDSSISETLLSESPGMIYSQERETLTQSLNSMHLYSKEEEQIESLATTLTVSRNIFVNNYKNVIFTLDDLTKVEDLDLLFSIKESNGPIIIKINEHEIFSGDLRNNNLPLNIPKGYLLEGENKITFKSTFPWTLIINNYYILQNVNLIKNLELTNIESTRTFYIDEPEDVKKAELTYFVFCNKDDNGELTILLNNHEVFSDPVFCNYWDERELILDSQYLTTRNELRFIINKGDYNLDEVEIEIFLKDSDYPTFGFEIDDEIWDEILDGAEIELQMTFENAENLKKGSIVVQEETFNFNTLAEEYNKEITSMVDNGYNLIKIQPENNFELVNLKVVVKN